MTAAAEPQALAALPDAAALSALVDGLLDRGTSAAQEDQPVLPGRDVAVVAAYVDATTAVRTVVLLDLTLATCLGGALALVPPPRVAEALEAGAVPGDLADNTKEVLNVAASLFDCGDVHLKLADVAVAPQPVAAHCVDFLRVPRRRTDLTMTVPGYGAGRIAIIAG